MKELQETGKLPNISKDPFRTPRRSSPRDPTTALKSTTAKRNRSPESSRSTSTSKRTSLPRVQSTLTQIDFVTQPPASDDDTLDYIDEDSLRDIPNDTYQRARVDDGSDKDSDFFPAPSVRSARNVNPKMSERARNSSDRPQDQRSSGIANRDAGRSRGIRKSETPRAAARPRGGRKSLEKSTGKRDKTLTQMDFVRRYITIHDDDDDVNMGYIQPTPHKAGIKPEKTEHTPRPNISQAAKRPSSVKRKRRVYEKELDLSTGEPISQSTEAQASNSEYGGERASSAPVTPQKSRTREIPSSQTPESPGLAIITSSQFRTATRTPSKQKPWDPTNDSMKSIKEESQEIRRVVEDSHDTSGESLPQTTPLEFPHRHNLLNRLAPKNNNEEFPSSAPPTESIFQEKSTEASENSRNTKRERTVVYETDADSEYEESEDSLNKIPGTPTPKKNSRAINQRVVSQGIRNSPDSPRDDSQELPLPDVQSSPGLEDVPPSDGPMSDASIFYHRMHAATQFPHEPIPTLNTQKMSELFPLEGSTQYPKSDPLRPTLRDHAPGPFSQTQTQSQEGDKELTDMVPESSPTREREHTESGEPSFRRPHAPGSVVQVESSQAVDRDPHWQGRLLSRSQLLTSSVMESIPLPDFCMGSQDSVGEPYSLPEG
ncbi:hypothetical protein N7475_005090 [Penicillium sp. IBT 31633x]|nr:hypothetical protein N7475_005090 [Penicillium sp. IBT 31633x]